MSGIFATSVAKILTMPKPLSQDEDAELAAFRARDARWLQLADAALSAAEKTIQALELAKEEQQRIRDRKSTRLNSSHGYISYAVFCLKKKKKKIKLT